MKIHQFLTAALFVTTLASTATAARFYAQPSIGFAEVTGYKAKAGPSLAVGVLFAGKHAVEIEGGSFDMRASYDADSKLEVIPVTLNYRYEFPIVKRLSGSIGLALGMTRQEADFTYISFVGFPFPSSYYFSRYTASDDAFAAGFSGGLNFRLNDHFALTLGAKGLHVAETKLVGRGTMLVGQLGLNCRW